MAPWFLKPQADQTILRTSAHGFGVYFQQKGTVVTYLSRRRPVSADEIHDKDDEDFITFDQLQFVFILYGLGNAAAIVAFAIENWIQRISIRFEKHPFKLEFYINS